MWTSSLRNKWKACRLKFIHKAVKIGWIGPLGTDGFIRYKFQWTFTQFQRNLTISIKIVIYIRNSKNAFDISKIRHVRIYEFCISGFRYNEQKGFWKPITFYPALRSCDGYFFVWQMGDLLEIWCTVCTCRFGKFTFQYRDSHVILNAPLYNLPTTYV